MYRKPLGNARGPIRAATVRERLPRNTRSIFENSVLSKIHRSSPIHSHREGVSTARKANSARSAISRASTAVPRLIVKETSRKSLVRILNFPAARLYVGRSRCAPGCVTSSRYIGPDILQARSMSPTVRSLAISNLPSRRVCIISRRSGSTFEIKRFLPRLDSRRGDRTDCGSIPNANRPATSFCLCSLSQQHSQLLRRSDSFGVAPQPSRFPLRKVWCDSPNAKRR